MKQRSSATRRRGPRRSVRRSSSGHRMQMRLPALALAAALGCVAHAQSGTAAPEGTAATPPLRVLLDRAAAYVHEFVVSFSNVVAEEDFRQEWLNGERRRLTSEF